MSLQTETRKAKLLRGEEVVLKVEGRHTNLRIIPNHDSSRFCFRLDKYKEYSVPLPKGLAYLCDQKSDSVKAACELARRWGFDKSTLEDLDAILEITEKMQERKLLDW